MTVFSIAASPGNATSSLIDATNPFGNGMSLPAGPMREGISAIRRCQIVLITRCESVDQTTIDDLIKKVSRFIDEIANFPCVHGHQDDSNP